MSPEERDQLVTDTNRDITNYAATHPGLVELIALRYAQTCADLDALEREAV